MFIDLTDLVTVSLNNEDRQDRSQPLRWCPCSDPVDTEGDLCFDCLVEWHTQECKEQIYGTYDILDEDWLSDLDYTRIKAYRELPEPVIFTALLDEWISTETHRQAMLTALYAHDAGCACALCLEALDEIPI